MRAADVGDLDSQTRGVIRRVRAAGMSAAAGVQEAYRTGHQAHTCELRQGVDSQTKSGAAQCLRRLARMEHAPDGLMRPHPWENQDDITSTHAPIAVRPGLDAFSNSYVRTLLDAVRREGESQTRKTSDPRAKSRADAEATAMKSVVL